MELDASQLRTKLQTILVTVRGLSTLPKTSIGLKSIDIMHDIEGDPELLEMAFRWLSQSATPSTNGMSDDAKSSWETIRIWMPHIEKMLKAME